MPSLFTMMFAPTAGVASYLAWIIESAWACVSSGADLQPAKTIPAPKIAKDIKTFIFATFFTFPPLDTHDWLIYFDPPFLSYFPLLSMELEVTGRTTDRLILWKSPGQPKIEAKLPPSFTAPPVSVPSPRQSGPREIQEIPSRPRSDRLILWKSPGQPKIEAKLPPSFTAPPVSVPSPRQSGPREIQEIPSRPSVGD